MDAIAIKDEVETFLTPLFDNVTVRATTNKCCGTGYLIFATKPGHFLAALVNKSGLSITSYTVTNVLQSQRINFYSNVDTFKDFINIF